MTHPTRPSSPVQKSKRRTRDATGESELRVRKACLKDAKPILNEMRGPDRRELGLLDPSDDYALDRLKQGISQSDPCFTIHIDGKPVGVYGTVPGTLRGKPVGICWLLGTEDLVHPVGNKIQFLRESKARLSELHEHHEVLWNFIDSRNTLHIKWIKWLGFEIINSVELGPDRVVFHEFIRTRDV